MNQPHVLASFDLQACEYRGRVLFDTDPDRSIEDRFFPGWWNILNPSLGRLAKMGSSSWTQVIEDLGQPVLEWSAEQPCLIVAGDATWGDYDVAAPTRVVKLDTFPYYHDEMTHDFRGRTGLALRVQDSRRHVFAGFVDGQAAVIALRLDASWVELNRTEFDVDRNRYHRLEARCRGSRVELWGDGRLLIGAEVPWPTGAAGVYANTAARWVSASIACDHAARKAVEQRSGERDQALRAAQAKTPQAVQVAEVKLSPPDGIMPAFGRVLKPGRFLVHWKQSATDHVIAAVDVSGGECWRRELKGAGGTISYKAHDIDLDGTPEVAIVGDSRMYVLNGDTGEIRAEADTPMGTPFTHMRNATRMRSNAQIPKVWHTAGPKQPARLYLIEWTGAGGHVTHSYDHQLRHRWTHTNYSGKFGHDIASYDVNGDGCDEVVAGYYALDDGGKVVWAVPGQDLIFKQDHTDRVCVGPMTPGGVPQVLVAVGERGLHYIDARNGDWLHHVRNIGHIQRLVVGRFVHEGDAKQAWFLTDWGSPGIYFLLDDQARILHRMQPDSRCTDATTVTWWPDGRDLLLIEGTPKARGLWNAQGQRVIDLSNLPKPIAVIRLTDDRTDQLACLEGDTLRVFGPAVA